MIKSELSPGRKVFIEGDKFEIVKKTDRRKSTGCYEYLLRPLDEDILGAKIYYSNSKKILLEIIRKVDCKIGSRSIKFKGDVYQVSKQYDNIYYDKEKDVMIRDNVYELLKPKENILKNVGPRRIVVNSKKEKVLYDFREITMNEFSFKNNSTENLEGRKETVSFVYKFKEPVG